MRVLTGVVAVVALPGLVLAADQPARPSTKAPEEKPAPQLEKPVVRSIKVKSGNLLFDVLLRPGVPDPERVVEVFVEMAEVPPVPDPIYGERIPIKDAQITAEVTDVDGEGYTVAYQVHPLQDAGSYGFHFTPLRKDKYRVLLRGVHNEKKFSPSFRVPVGIWPLLQEADQEADSDKAAKSPAEPASGRLPAVPSGVESPAVPSSFNSAGRMAGKKLTPLQDAMQRLSDLWVRAGVALMVDRKPNLKETRSVAAQMKKVVQEVAGLNPSDSEFTTLVGEELLRAVEALERAAGSGKPKNAVDAFKQVSGQHCNRCHLKLRWKMDEGL